MKLSSLLKLTAATGVALAASACGPMRSSPAPDYDQVRSQSIPASDQAQTRQAARVQGNFISFTSVGNLNFVEGEAAELLVFARITQLASLQYELVMRGLPDDARIERVQHEGRQAYRILWTPQPGFIPERDASRAIRLEVELQSVAALPPAEQALLDRETRTQTFNITVARTGEHPVVETVTGLSEVIQEGTIANFTVDVDDAGARGDVAPRLLILRETSATNEIVGIDGSPMISVDPAHAEPVKLSSGKWRFHYIFDSLNHAVPRPSRLAVGNQRMAADEIPVRFKIEILSPSRLSTVTSQEFKLKYNASRPSPAGGR